MDLKSPLLSKWNDRQAGRKAVTQGMGRKGEHPERTKRKALDQPFGGWCGAFFFLSGAFHREIGSIDD